MSKILVLEDELTIRSFIVLNLKRAGFLCNRSYYWRRSVTDFE